MLHRFVMAGVSIAVAGLLWTYTQELSPWLMLPVLWLASVPLTVGVFACAELPAGMTSAHGTVRPMPNDPARSKPVPERHSRSVEAARRQEREPTGQRA